MPLQPSRRDTAKPEDVLRHHQSYLRSLDPGYLDGRLATPQPVRPGTSLVVGGDDGGDAEGDAGIAFENGDRLVAVGSGTVTFDLTYEPIDGSLHVRWNGIDQPPSEWSLDGQTVTIPDPTALIDAGDLFTAAYAYYLSDVEEAPDIITPGVTYEASTGWRWAPVPPTADLDYSDPAFDDSGWAEDAAPFGQTNPPHDPSVFLPRHWPDYATTWVQTTRMWARRTILVEAGVSVTISLRWNRAITVWWNGSQVYSNGAAAGEATFTLPEASVLASNLLAIKTVDDAFTGPGTGCYFDAQVVQ